METVLLATDGSDDARRAAREAVRYAEREDADLDVLCVVDRRKYSEPAFSSDELAAIQVEDAGQLYVDEVVEMADGTGVTVTGEVTHGVPHEVILEHAARRDADLIVVGEYGGRDEHFAGVRRKVTKHAGCDVVVVPSGG